MKALKLLNMPLLALSLLLLLSACSSNDKGGSGAGPVGKDPSEFSGKPGDCREFISKLPADYFHDWIEVPENPFVPSGNKIKIFYYGKVDSNNVVIFYNGGPGSSSHGVSDAFDKEITSREIKGKISFIYMDQRGTGCSTAYPSNKTNEDILRAEWWGSTGIVYDSEALREKLIGNRKWKVFGQSYGAFIVHRYVSLFPKSIDKAYAHANTIFPDPSERLFFRIQSQVKVLNMFLSTYPTSREKIKLLGDYLTADKCFPTAHDKFCGREVLEGFISFLGFSNRWSKLDQMISRLVPDGQVSNLELQNFAEKYLDEDGVATGYSMTVLGYFDRNVLPSDYKYCAIVQGLLISQGGQEDDLRITECGSALQFKQVNTSRDKIIGVLQGQQDLLTLEKFKLGLQNLSPMSFYLYSGEKDTYVPKLTFGPELESVGNLVNYFHFMNSGHEGYRTENQVWEDLLK